jgi:hypothetical protein
MEIGVTYTFSQADRSNFYHPMGFSYFADGAHAELDELEPGIPPPGSGSSCDEGMTCPAPMYFLGDTYLGTYSNIAEVLAPTKDEDNFGLDDYEPLFFRPITEWSDYGDFSLMLRFDEDSFKGDIFYFCHIHELMTGRIKLLKDGVPIQETDSPEIPYTYDTPGPFDMKCGTFGLDAWQLPNDQCFDRFVCDVPDDDPSLQQFSDCIDAMDCSMLSGMTTGISSGSATALFIHQMVPHHQNAVNMAKALLHTQTLSCDDLTDESDDCVMETILREIINGQNFQIQTMYNIAESLGYPRTDDCEVLISQQLMPDMPTPAASPVASPDSTDASSDNNTSPGKKGGVGMDAKKEGKMDDKMEGVLEDKKEGKMAATSKSGNESSASRSKEGEKKKGGMNSASKKGMGGK